MARPGGRSSPIADRTRTTVQEAATQIGIHGRKRCTYSRSHSRDAPRCSLPALRRAIRDVFGEPALVHRCHRHKERNVLDLLPERDRPRILARVRGAWALKDVVEAEQQLERLAAELEKSWPDAAASLREGMTETLTLIRLGITGRLAKTLSSTNPIESMIEIVRHTQRNVKRWQDGDMRKRWTAAGMLQAEQQFRRIVGYSDLAKLVTAIEQRHLTLESQNTPQPPEVRTDTVTSEDAAQLVTV